MIQHVSRLMKWVGGGGGGVRFRVRKGVKVKLIMGGRKGCGVE